MEQNKKWFVSVLILGSLMFLGAGCKNQSDIVVKQQEQIDTLTKKIESMQSVTSTNTNITQPIVQSKNTPKPPKPVEKKAGNFDFNTFGEKEQPVFNPTPQPTIQPIQQDTEILIEKCKVSSLAIKQETLQKAYQMIDNKYEPDIQIDKDYINNTRNSYFECIKQPLTPEELYAVTSESIGLVTENKCFYHKLNVESRIDHLNQLLSIRQQANVKAEQLVSDLYNQEYAKCINNL